MAEPATPAPKSLADAVQAPSQRPSLDHFLDCLFVEMGGPGAMAKIVADELHTSRPGSLIRARIIEGILRSLRKDDRTKEVDHEHLITDEDLHRYLAERERLLVASLGVVNGDDPRLDEAGRAGAQPASPAGASASPTSGPGTIDGPRA